LRGRFSLQSADNPVFDTRLHQVQFPDRGVEEYSTNIIAECLYSKIDQKGNQYVIILEEIIDYDNEEQEDTTLNSMKGWQLCVLWKDGTTSWEHLRDMKHGFPIQAEEYAVSRGLQDQPVFSW